MASQESKTTSSSSEGIICDSCKEPVHEDKYEEDFPEKVKKEDSQDSLNK